MKEDPWRKSVSQWIMDIQRDISDLKELRCDLAELKDDSEQDFEGIYICQLEIKALKEEIIGLKASINLLFQSYAQMIKKQLFQQVNHVPSINHQSSQDSKKESH